MAAAAQVGWAFCAVAICLILTVSAETEYHYEIKEFAVPLDHFSYSNNATFNIRYLVNDSFVDKGNARPAIFFYTGNEGDIEWFCKNTGFLWDLGQELRALVVYAEHRYYGKSLPFGADTFNSSRPEHLAYFTVEQTLEDFALLITYLRNGHELPVVAFGGSYGGMLASWFRMKYPHIVEGALASSAPIWQFGDQVPCDIFNRITTSIFKNAYNANCSLNIANAGKAFTTLGATDAGKKQLGDGFRVCEPIKTADDLNTFLDYIEGIYASLAMANYPYNTSFLAPLPANPVRQVCFYLRDLHSKDADLIAALSSALAVYTNYTGTVKCLDYKNPGGNSNADSAGWDIQECNQMVMPFCSNSSNSMFRPYDWNFKADAERCFRKYKLTPKINDILLRYGGKHIEAASNIIFSNGLLDPWSGGGVLQAPNDRIHIIIIPEGAHHLDLRSRNPADPASVVNARAQETAIISKWLSDFQRRNS